MIRPISLALCFAASLSLSAAFAQTEDQAASSPKPITYVYVAGPTQIDGFTVASNGKLTRIPGSPFPYAVQSLVGNGKNLFGVNGNQVESFSIAANGSVKLTETSTISEPSGSCGLLTDLALDHSGSTLYLTAIAGAHCEDTDYLSYRIASGGKLKYLGDSGDIFLWNSPLTVSSNDKFAYGTRCLDNGAGFFDTFSGYTRNSSGRLTLNAGIALPNLKPETANDVYCAKAIAADPAGHLAISLQPIDSISGYPVGKAQLGVFSINAQGKLSTASTWKNMPTSGTGATDLSISPSGKFLAVGGEGLESGGSGFQVFHFNGSNPISKETSTLQYGSIFYSFAWDNQGHLFALGGGQLFVYSVTGSSVTQAPNSPYSFSEFSTVLFQSVAQ